MDATAVQTGKPTSDQSRDHGASWLAQPVKGFYGWAAAFAVVFTLGIFALNYWALCDGEARCTLTRVSSTRMLGFVELHTTHDPFRLRILFTPILRLLIDDVGLTPRRAYRWTQYTYLFVFFSLSAAYAQVLFGRTRAALLVVAVLAASFPLLLMEYFPMSTWDDIATHCLLLLTLMAA